MNFWPFILVLTAATGGLVLLRGLGLSAGSSGGMLREYERLLRESREHKARQREKEQEEGS